MNTEFNIGIDGCRHGWIGVFRSQGAGELRAVLIENLAAFDHLAFAYIAIDIPIGLPEVGSRDCDKQARALLGQRGCCVFPAPLRSLMSATTYQEACGRRYAVEGKKISKQTWNLFKKIREVDELLRRDSTLSSKVYEVHPEVSFCKMNKNTPLETRKSRSEGREERSRLVESYFGLGVYTNLRNSLMPRDSWQDDDLLDACSVLWTAERIANGAMHVLPDDPQFDAMGLPMRIVC